MKENEVLLIIDRQNFEEILSGKKTEEYRSLTDFYAKKFMLMDKNGEYTRFADIKYVWLANGYSATRKMAKVEVRSVNIDRFINFIPENFKKGDEVFTLELGKIIEIINP